MNACTIQFSKQVLTSQFFYILFSCSSRAKFYIFYPCFTNSKISVNKIIWAIDLFDKNILEILDAEHIFPDLRKSIRMALFSYINSNNGQPESGALKLASTIDCCSSRNQCFLSDWWGHVLEFFHLTGNSTNLLSF